jgi:hypothetical protein
MADKKPASKKSKPIADVAKPGTTAPSPSAKPVIVTNRPMLKDPMVVDDKSAADSAASGENITVKVTSQAKSLQPAAESDAATAPELPAEEKTTASDAEAAPPPPTTDQEKKLTETSKKSAAKPEPKTAAKSPAPPKTETADTDDQDDDQKAAPMPSEAEQEAAEAAQAEHDAAIQKLIDSKQYNLSINTVEKRKSKHFVILGVILSLVLAAAWADIALDAGLVHIHGVKPVTHFFSN